MKTVFIVLQTKLNMLRCNIYRLKTYDFLALIENWLFEDIIDGELGLDNFNIFKSDRNKKKQFMFKRR